MAFFEDLSRKVQDVAFAAAEKGKELSLIHIYEHTRQ